MTPTEAPRVLKADALRGLGSKVVFNLDDVRRRCEEHLERVREQARQILASAQAEAATLRARTLEEARTQGRTEGLRAAEQEIERRATLRAERMAAESLKTALPALKCAADALVAERDRWLSDWESSAVTLATAIAEKLLRVTLDTHPEAAAPMIREALQLALGAATLRLRMNPQDIPLLGDDAAQVVRIVAACGEAEIVPDAAVSRGGCLIETRRGSIDARLETLLDRIAAELLQREPPARAASTTDEAPRT